MVPRASYRAFRWAAWACRIRITPRAPALRDCQIAEQGPGPREARWKARRWNPTPATAAHSDAPAHTAVVQRKCYWNGTERDLFVGCVEKPTDNTRGSR